MAWTEEKIRKLPADGEAAEKIINEYGGVLEIASNMTYGAPQSLLPHPKGEIKQAIMTCLLRQHLTKTLDEKSFNVLEVGYASLANFLDDADARVAVAAQADFNTAIATARDALNSEDINREDINRAAERMSSPNLMAADERLEKSMEEFRALSEEFHAVAVKMGILYAKTPDQLKEAWAQAATSVAEEAAQRDRLLKEADHGDAIAQFMLGFMYDQGKGVPQNFAEAVKWYSKAADQGDARAQHALGMHYTVSGMGVEQDYAQAVQWLRKAADQGHASAQFSLGNMYLLGNGVPQVYTEAVKWYRRAAEQGYAAAQFNLGTMYFNGQGAPQDFVQAHKWYNLAASRYPASEKESRERAVKNRDLVAAKMTPAQIAEAQKLAREWKPKPES